MALSHELQIKISLNDEVNREEVIELYKANKWSSANKPEKLIDALRDSHSLVTARLAGELVGIANAISDGHLVVYYPHLLVLPEYHRKGIGTKMINALLARYANFHQQLITADVNAVEFYRNAGFNKAGRTQSMWIYDGGEH